MLSMFEVSKFKLRHMVLQHCGKHINLYVVLCEICHTKFNNRIIIWIKTNFCTRSAWANCRSGSFVSLKDKFTKNFSSLKMKTFGMDMKSKGCPLRLFWKTIYKLGNAIHPKTKVTMRGVEKFKVLCQCKKFKG